MICRCNAACTARGAACQWVVVGAGFDPLFVGNGQDEQIYRSSGITKSQHELLQNTGETCMREAGIKQGREAARSVHQRKETG